MKKRLVILGLIVLLLFSCDKSTEIVRSVNDDFSGSALKEMVDINLIAYDSVEFSVKPDVVVPSTRIKYIYWQASAPPSQFTPYDTIEPQYEKSGENYRMTFPAMKEKIYDNSAVNLSYTVRFEFDDKNSTDVMVSLPAINYAYENTSLFLDCKDIIGNLSGSYFDDIEVTDSLALILPGTAASQGKYYFASDNLVPIGSSTNTDFIGIIGNKIYSTFSSNNVVNVFNKNGDFVDTIQTGYGIYGLDASGNSLYILVPVGDRYHLLKYSESKELLETIILPYTTTEIQSVEDIEIDNGILYLIYYKQKVKRYNLNTQSQLEELKYPIKSLGGMDVRNGVMYSADDDRLVIVKTPVGEL